MIVDDVETSEINRNTDISSGSDSSDSTVESNFRKLVVLPFGLFDPLDYEDYEGGNGGDYTSNSAFAEFLENYLDEGDDSGEDRPIPTSTSTDTLIKLNEENRQLRERLEGKSEPIAAGLLNELQFETDRRKSLEFQLQEAQRKLEELDKELDALINIFQEEMNQRDEREQNLRKDLEDASNTIEELVGKLKLLENKRVIS